MSHAAFCKAQAKSDAVKAILTKISICKVFCPTAAGAAQQ